MWHAAEEGLRSCGVPVCHSVNADLPLWHTFPYHRAGADAQTWTQSEMERKKDGKEGGWERVKRGC